jgi:hypothetical protein
MKTKPFIIVIAAMLFTACSPQVPTQEIERANDVSTATSSAEATMTPEFTATLEPVPTSTPTIPPSSTPSGCPTLLTPLNGTEVPAIGKVTFSWDPVDKATVYVLNLILPSGQTVSFETKQTFRGQYMEAFPAGGSYQWSVSAYTQGRKRNEICSSILATFSKPFSDQPQQPNNDRKKK